jgi:capsule polysaccharide export protein KpsE/RkpR
MPALRRSVLAGTAAALMAGALTLALPDVFRSKILVYPKGGTAGPLAALAATAAMFAGGFGGQVEEEAHYLDIIESRWMAENLLDAVYTFDYQSWALGGHQARQEALTRFLDVRTPRDREAALRWVSRAVAGRRDLKSGTITVTAEAPSPQLAQQMADKVVAFLNQALRRRLQQQAADKAEVAGDLILHARAKAEAARGALEAFARNHANFALSLDSGIRTNGERLSAELALRQQVVASLILTFEQADLETKNHAPVLSTLAPAFLPLEKEGPARKRWILAAMALGALGAALWNQRGSVWSALKGPLPTQRPEGARLLDE